MTDHSKQPDFRLNSDSRALVESLQDIKIGETVQYSRLSQIIGRDVQGVASASLNSARRVVEREHRIVFGTIRGVGIKRLEDADIVKSTDKSREHIRRTSRRAVRRLGCVDYQNLTAEQQTKHNAAMSVFGVLSEVAAEKSIRRIEKKIEESGEELSIAKSAIEALGLVK